MSEAAVTPTEVDTQVSAVNRVRPVGPVEMRERVYRQFASRVAVVDGERSVTYAELGSDAHRIASALAAHGMERGQRGLIVTRNCYEYFAVEQALALGGFVRIAVNPRLHPEEVAFIANDVGVSVLFVDESWAEQAVALADKVPTLRHVVSFGAAPAGAQTLAEFVTGVEDRHFPYPHPEDVLGIGYTSGTTGRPKGAILTHRMAAATARLWWTVGGPMTDHEVVLHGAPLANMSAVWGAPYFLIGATHVLHPSFDVAATLRDIEHYQVTTMFLVTTMLNRIVDAAKEASFLGPSVTTILYGGSPTSLGQIQRAYEVFGAALLQVYGMTEFHGMSALSREKHVEGLALIAEGRGDEAPWMKSAGQPFPFVELKVIDATGADLPLGEEGEILIRGDNGCSGYWGLPDATNELIDADGWLHSGDVGRFDAEGNLYIVDRKKEMIISGGLNVYPTEVEQAILALPDVVEAAVYGIPDDDWGERVAATLVRRPGSDLDAEGVTAACRARIAGYKIPRSIEFAEELPKNTGGKILRRVLRDQHRDQHREQYTTG